MITFYLSITETMENLSDEISHLNEALKKLSKYNEYGILRWKYEKLVTHLHELMWEVYECDGVDQDGVNCDYIAVSQNGDEGSEKCSECNKRFCKKHYHNCNCNYGCSEV